MATGEDPIVDQWYQLVDKERQFKVISIEETAGIVEVQYMDGEIEEMDIDDWYALDVESIDEPEDWAAKDEEAEAEEEEDWAEDDVEEDAEEDEDEDDEDWDDDYKDPDEWDKDY